MAPLPTYSETTLQIRALNDRFRQTPIGQTGQLIMTRSVGDLPVDELVALLERMATFSEFTPDNDPHGEHDFGAIDQNAVRYFWKIDYYNLTMDAHSPDASNPAVTKRVLTLMRADEY